MSETPPSTPSGPSLPILVHPSELLLRTWVELFRVHHGATRELERLLTRHGLSTAQFDVLANLHSGEGITQTELAERLLVTKGNVCGLVDRMAGRGWLERRPDPEDRRAHRLHLTDEGRSLIRRVLPDQRALIHEYLGGLKLTDLWALQELLSRVGPTTSPKSFTTEPFAESE